jgi:hypothetical protein
MHQEAGIDKPLNALNDSFYGELTVNSYIPCRCDFLMGSAGSCECEEGDLNGGKDSPAT